MTLALILRGFLILLLLHRHRLQVDLTKMLKQLVVRAKDPIFSAEAAFIFGLVLLGWLGGLLRARYVIRRRGDRHRIMLGFAVFLE